MKTIRISLFSATILSFVLPIALRAQEMPQSSTPSNNQESPQPPPPGSWPRSPMANLTEQERSQLKAAHDKATQQNPALEEAIKSALQNMDKARDDMHQAMVAIDPSVAPILAKIEPPKWERKEKKWEKKERKMDDRLSGNQRHGLLPGMAKLTEPERKQLKAAHEQIKSNPSVVAAREALKTAATPEARRTAFEALRQAADAALLKVDPSLAPILEKLHQTGDSSSPDSNKEESMAPAQ